MTRRRGHLRRLSAGLTVALALLTAACTRTAAPTPHTSPSAAPAASSPSPTSGSAEPAEAATSRMATSRIATSAADFGGMDALVAAAEREGRLTVIGLAPHWAGYAEVIRTFEQKYPEIEVVSLQPDASSAQELQAAKATEGTPAAPDVFDLGTQIAVASADRFAPYKVIGWDEIPEANKEPSGLWVNDYAGIMTVGYNADKYGEISSLDQLTDPRFKGAVALNGNPAQTDSARNGVVFAALAKGGSPQDIAKGIEYFKSLRQAGTFSSVVPTPQVMAAGQLGVVFDWSYNQLAVADQLRKQGVAWKMFTPPGIVLGSFYSQAINKDAPHPAAARLWQEHLFSDQVQNLFLANAVLPVRYERMAADGTLDPVAAAVLPGIYGPVRQLSAEQADRIHAQLVAGWNR